MALPSLAREGLGDDQGSLVQAGVSEWSEQSGGGEKCDELFHGRWSFVFDLLFMRCRAARFRMRVW